MGIEVTKKGPLFDGRAPHIINEYQHELEQKLADTGVNMVEAALVGVLKHPTGYYQSRIQTDRRSGGYEINDSGVIYGPWLEGTGSRNDNTRFKGYATFRKVTQKLDAQAGEIAERVLPHYLRRLD